MSRPMTAGERAIWAAVFAKHYDLSSHDDALIECEQSEVTEAIKRAGRAVKHVRESDAEASLGSGSFALECWFDMTER